MTERNILKIQMQFV